MRTTRAWRKDSCTGKVHYLWDASYLNGRYYLYFTPLPALVFYMPFRLIYGAYPSDQFAAAVFAAWAFVMAVLFVKRALSGERHVPLPIWIVMLGLGNVVPFIMVFSRTYEVAALCGMAMTATWAWCVLRYLESPLTSRLIYLFASPVFSGEFPFADLPPHRLDPAVSYNQWSEEVGGLAPLVPLAIVGSVFAVILALRKEPKDTGTRAAHFMLLITMGAIVCVERGLTFLQDAGVSIRPLRIATIVLACYSTLLGILIAFKGTNDEFGKSNEELFRRLSDLF